MVGHASPAKPVVSDKRRRLTGLATSVCRFSWNKNDRRTCDLIKRLEEYQARCQTRPRTCVHFQVAFDPALKTIERSPMLGTDVLLVAICLQ